MYKIINKNTGNEFICDKVTIEGYDYYHLLEKGINSDNGFFIFKSDNGFFKTLVGSNIRVKTPGSYYKLIATTNPNIECNLITDVLNGIEEAETFLKNSNDFETEGFSEYQNGVFNGFIYGFNKAKEIHQFTKEDMIEFAEWLTKFGHFVNGTTNPFSELLVIWNDQRTKILYIE